MRRSGYRAWTLGLLLLLLAAPRLAVAQAKTVRNIQRDAQLVRQAGRLEISFAFPEVFDEKLRRRLSSGFTSRLQVEVLLFAPGRKEPVASAMLQHTILYDIWEERFSVRTDGVPGLRDRQVGSMDDLIRMCSTLQALLLRAEAEQPFARARAEVRVVVNPASPEQRRRIRDYLANPDGRGPIGTPRSFFGSFSRMFVNEKEMQADAIYLFHSREQDLAGGSR